MAVKERLTDDELLLIDVIEDPVWFPELLRNTRDLSPYRTTWPSEPFSYRPYQKDLLSDQSPRIVLRGGRAIGKCQPATARVLTPMGYRTIRSILNDPDYKGTFITYAVNHDQTALVPRRAYITKDIKTDVYEVVTKDGHTIQCTMSHPFLTPDGYKKLEELLPNDFVTVATILPYNSPYHFAEYGEVRLLGYKFLDHAIRPELSLKPKTNGIRSDVYNIAKDIEHAVFENSEGVIIKRKATRAMHYLWRYITDSGMRTVYSTLYGEKNSKNLPRKLAKLLMHDSLDNIRFFLEALFAQFADIQRTKVSLYLMKNDVLSEQLQELLLRFGVESYDDGTSHLIIDRPKSLYKFFTEFQLPGYSVANLQEPQDTDATPFMRYVQLERITYLGKMQTYAVSMYQDHNYISEGFIVHNSIVEEDKFLYDVMNQDIVFPDTKEQLLVTANQSQLEPILGRLISRFTTSHIFKDFLQNRINRSLGILEFRFREIVHLIRARIAGKDDANLIGLHLPRITIDEAQVFLVKSWTQLSPSLNAWERNTQLFFAGVPSGLRQSLLYHAEFKLQGFKTYHVPAHNNPFYTQEDDLENIKKYGGRDTDDYQQLVLGEHGKASSAVIMRDQMAQQPFDFHRIVYTNNHIAQGIAFQTLDRPNLTEFDFLCAGIDCGYVDPTVISILGYKQGSWYVVVRYVLRRVDFRIQEDFVHWLMEKYHFAKIGIDASSAGGGMGMIDSLLHRDDFKTIDYSNVIVPVVFGERIPVGFTTDGRELTTTTKTYGASLLVQHLQEHTIVLSEVDYELVSELERITKQRGVSNDDRYFILSEKGNGASPDDHNFASMICFTIATRDLSFQRRKRRALVRPRGRF